MFLVFWLGSRILDRTTAVIAALLLAILPTAIGYSRFGWDASQTPLFSVPALYFASRGKTLAMLISFAFCLIVHLSNLFLLPILLAPFFVALWIADREPRKRRLILGMVAVLGLIAFLTLVVIDWRLDHALMVFSAVPGNWLCFLGHYGRLISGLTLYEYVVGPVAQRTQDRYDGAFWGLFLALVGLGVPHLVRSRRWDRLALIAGLVLGALALYLAAGPEIIGPHHERYGMYLIVPTILVTACLISALLPDSDGAGCRIARQLAFAVMLAGAWVWLFFFNVHYFDALRATGGESHRTFRTAEVEPKEQAVRLILADIALRNPATGRRADIASSHRNPDSQVGRGDGSTQPVIAEDRWLYWPLRFLASRQPGYCVVSFDNDQPWPGPATGARKAARDNPGVGGIRRRVCWGSVRAARRIHLSPESPPALGYPGLSAKKADHGISGSIQVMGSPPDNWF